MARTTRKTEVSTLMSSSSQMRPIQSSPSRPRRSSARRAVTQEQIAERAKAIWQSKGCQTGQDLDNWLEAETQLKAEIQASC